MVSSMFTRAEREFHAISVVCTSRFFPPYYLNNEQACYFHSSCGDDSLFENEIRRLILEIICCLPGHNQSPTGNFAMISTRPYLNEKDFSVDNRALCTGFMMIFPPAWRSHCFLSRSVQLSKWMYPCSIWSVPILPSVNVGLMCNFLFLTKLFASSAVYHSNSPFCQQHSVLIFFLF